MLWVARIVKSLRITFQSSPALRTREYEVSTATIPDLWPEFRVSADPSPAAILRQQAMRLGERTRNAVFGEVETKHGVSSSFVHTLYICAPFLDVRQYAILIRHGIDRYPATAILLDAGGQHVQTREVETSGELLAALREMLQSPHIVQLVSSLISQSQDIEE